MSERIARIEAHLEYLVEAEKKRDESCASHQAQTYLLKSRVEDLEQAREHAEAVVNTLTVTAKTGWKLIGAILGIGAAFMATFRYAHRICEWMRAHL